MIKVAIQNLTKKCQGMLKGAGRGGKVEKDGAEGKKIKANISWGWKTCQAKQKFWGVLLDNPPPPGKETNTDGPSSCSPKQRKRLGGAVITKSVNEKIRKKVRHS